MFVPLLTLFSPRMLEDPETVARELREQGHGELVAFMSQQILKFRLQGESFSRRYSGMEEMEKVWRGLLRSVPAVERLDGMTPEQRVEGLSAEELMSALSPAMREQLFRLLQQEQQKPPKHDKNP